jgi:hypothetical protein
MSQDSLTVPSFFRTVEPTSDGRRSLLLGYKTYENARAHWYLFVPSTTNPAVGKIIHVTGNHHSGFGFQIKLNQNVLLSIRHGYTHFVSLGSVAADQVVDDYEPNPDSGPIIRDYPIDGIETIAYNQGLPYRDPNAILPPVGDPIWAHSHPQFERCQEWTRRLVYRLVELGHLQPMAIQALNTATSFGLRL